MSNIHETKAKIDAVLSILRQVTVEEAQELVQSLDRQETLQPILDPTAYLKVRDHIPTAREVYSAFLTLRLAVEKAVEEAQLEEAK